jgi:two-component system sensor histidine kinase BaeS
VRRRLVVAIVGAVVAAIVVVGAGTLVLTRLDTRHRDEDDLAAQASALGEVLAEVVPGRARPLARQFEDALGVDAVYVVSLADPPAWVEPGDAERLRAGSVVAARDRSTTYAAAPILGPGGAPARPTTGGQPAPPRAVVLADGDDSGPGVAGRWFVVAGLATIALGVAAALWVARSLARPVAATAAAADRIAGGDLDARVPEPPGDRDDELARLARSVNEMAAGLARSRDAERDFLLSVSHDLRTPLTSIGGWAEALADGAAPDARAAGEIIRASAAQLDRLVRDLLDLARLRARAFTFTPASLDLRDVVAGTAEGLRPDLEDAGLALAVDLPPAPVGVYGDPDRLAQVVANLLDNAGRHAAARVRVAVTAAGGQAVVAVEDDGPGIPPAERPLVFERLHTGARPAARGGGGTGLGLAIVRELAGAMGGDAAAEDSRAGGARLVVTLPLTA